MQQQKQMQQQMQMQMQMVPNQGFVLLRLFSLHPSWEPVDVSHFNALRGLRMPLRDQRWAALDARCLTIGFERVAALGKCRHIRTAVVGHRDASEESEHLCLNAPSGARPMPARSLLDGCRGIGWRLGLGPRICGCRSATGTASALGSLTFRHASVARLGDR